MEEILDMLAPYIALVFFVFLPLIAISFVIVNIEKIIKAKKEGNAINRSWIIASIILTLYSIPLLLLDATVIVLLNSKPSIM